MSTQRPIVPFVTGSLFALACIACLFAGPINPPTGPVTAGGKTTQEIYDAVTANSQATGAIGGRGPAVPGASFTGGTFSMSTTPVVSGPILGMRSSFSTPVTISGGGSGTGTSVFNSLTIVRDMGASDMPIWKTLIVGTSISTCTITLPSTGGNTVYTLSNVFIAGLRHSFIQRADGTFAAIEEIDVLPTIVLQTDPSAGHYQWNYLTHVGQ